MKPQKPSYTRGLPDDRSIGELAEVWLEEQSKLWPELTAQGLVPKSTPEVIEQLRGRLKGRYLGTQTTAQAILPVLEKLACCYARYSCDRSNPRSLAQQLRLILQRARQIDHFIPWDFVFADAAITGTHSNRRGYQLAKECLAQEQRVVAFIFDEVDRASREPAEVFDLRRLAEDHRKRLIGASDGSDTAVEGSSIVIAVRGALSEEYIRQLKRKVNRGMKDAFREGRVVSGPIFGYKLEFCLDGSGQPIQVNGKHPRRMVVNTEIAPWVVKMFEMYGIDRRSLKQIATHFNEVRAGGRCRWAANAIAKLLKHKRYIGIEEYWRREKRNQGTNTVFRPEEEWLKRDIPALRIVSDDLWQKVQDRLVECSLAFKSRRSQSTSRTTVRRHDLYPSLLFHPVCGYCGKPLWKGRSGKYAALRCSNGVNGSLGCQLSGHKSVSIIEKSLVQGIKEKLLDQVFWDAAFNQANAYLQEEAVKPTVDLEPIVKKIDSKHRARKRMMDLLETTPDEDLADVRQRIATLSQEISSLRAEQKLVQAATEPPPATSIDRESFDRLIQDLRSTLNDEPAASAEALRALVGEVRITKADQFQGRKSIWLAEFSLIPAPALAIVAQRSNCPTTSTWEYLCRRSWTIDCPVRTVIVDRSKGALIARQVFPLASRQPTLEEIYAQTRLSILVIMALVAFYGLDAASVSSPSVPKSKQIGKSLYAEIGPIVVELRDRHLIPYRVIARDNHYAGATIIRAYHYQISKTRDQSKALGPAPEPFMPSSIIINRCKGIGRHYRLGTDPKRVASELGIPVQKVIRYRFVYAQIAQELDRWRRWG